MKGIKLGILTLTRLSARLVSVWDQQIGSKGAPIYSRGSPQLLYGAMRKDSERHFILSPLYLLK